MATRSRVGVRSLVAGEPVQAKVCTCTMTGSLPSFWSVTAAARWSGARSIRVGATERAAAIAPGGAASSSPTKQKGRSTWCLERQRDVDDVVVGAGRHRLAARDAAVDVDVARQRAEKLERVGVGARAPERGAAAVLVELVLELVAAGAHRPVVDVAGAAAVELEGQVAVAVGVVDLAGRVEVLALAGDVLAEAEAAAGERAAAQHRRCDGQVVAIAGDAARIAAVASRRAAVASRRACRVLDMISSSQGGRRER